MPRRRRKRRIQAIPSRASSVGRDPDGVGANDRTVTTWDASFVDGRRPHDRPEEGAGKTLQQRWAQPFPRTGGVLYAEAKNNAPRRSWKAFRLDAELAPQLSTRRPVPAARRYGRTWENANEGRKRSEPRR